jgi:hypothetical protein
MCCRRRQNMDGSLGRSHCVLYVCHRPVDRRQILVCILCRWVSSWCRYLSSMLFQSIRAECAQMDINERVLLTDEAGKSFYVPEL